MRLSNQQGHRECALICKLNVEEGRRKYRRSQFFFIFVKIQKFVKIFFKFWRFIPIFFVRFLRNIPSPTLSHNVYLDGMYEYIKVWPCNHEIGANIDIVRFMWSWISPLLEVSRCQICSWNNTTVAGISGRVERLVSLSQLRGNDDSAASYQIFNNTLRARLNQHITQDLHGRHSHCVMKSDPLQLKRKIITLKHNFLKWKKSLLRK